MEVAEGACLRVCHVVINLSTTGILQLVMFKLLTAVTLVWAGLSDVWTINSQENDRHILNQLIDTFNLSYHPCQRITSDMNLKHKKYPLFPFELDSTKSRITLDPNFNFNDDGRSQDRFLPTNVVTLAQILQRFHRTFLQFSIHFAPRWTKFMSESAHSADKNKII